LFVITFICVLLSFPLKVRKISKVSAGERVGPDYQAPGDGVAGDEVNNVLASLEAEVTQTVSIDTDSVMSSIRDAEDEGLRGLDLAKRIAEVAGITKDAAATSLGQPKKVILAVGNESIVKLPEYLNSNVALYHQLVAVPLSAEHEANIKGKVRGYADFVVFPESGKLDKTYIRNKLGIKGEIDLVTVVDNELDSDRLQRIGSDHAVMSLAAYVRQIAAAHTLLNEPNPQATLDEYIRAARLVLDWAA